MHAASALGGQQHLGERPRPAANQGAPKPGQPGGGRTRERKAPSSQPRWNAAEEELLVALVRSRTSDWFEIATRLGTGRSAAAVQQHHEILCGMRRPGKARLARASEAVQRQAMNPPIGLASAFAIPYSEADKAQHPPPPIAAVDGQPPPAVCCYPTEHFVPMAPPAKRVRAPHEEGVGACPGGPIAPSQPSQPRPSAQPPGAEPASEQCRDSADKAATAAASATMLQLNGLGAPCPPGMVHPGMPQQYHYPPYPHQYPWPHHYQAPPGFQPMQPPYHPQQTPPYPQPPPHHLNGHTPYLQPPVEPPPAACAPSAPPEGTAVSRGASDASTGASSQDNAGPDDLPIIIDDQAQPSAVAPAPAATDKPAPAGLGAPAAAPASNADPPLVASDADTPPPETNGALPFTASKVDAPPPTWSIADAPMSAASTKAPLPTPPTSNGTPPLTQA